MRGLPLSSYDGSVIQVGTKSDLGQAEGVDVAVSAFDDFSLDSLRSLIANRLEESQQHQWSDAMHQTAIRCREGIQSAGAAVKQAMGAVENDLGEEIIALEIRAAMDQLSSIIGEIHTEDILGEIFSRFCIGK
jgi:tRNA modification GTPase